jgi:uncharacterized protein YhaN
MKRLVQLDDALAKQRSLIEQRKTLAGEYRSLRKQLRKRERELEKLRGSRQRMIARVGADSEEVYRDFALKHQQINKLREKREGLCEQIAAALGNKFSEADIATELNSYGGTALESRWESLQSDYELQEKKQSKLNQQLGEHQQEMRLLAEDRRLDEARLELEMVRCQISENIAEWQVTAATCTLLESIREIYEAERQPETLKEASEFLCQISGGQYTRIWTKLSENVLLVDNTEGEALPVEVLSRGTRECVYLGLRLALVTAYSRRGAVLPLVLDDVLVNFDAARARKAAAALKSFSEKGFQVMMFTCHDHIRDMFADLDCDVRELPHHAEVHEENGMIIGPRFAELEEESVEAVEGNDEEVVEHETMIHVPSVSTKLPYEKLNKRLSYEFSAIDADRQSEPEFEAAKIKKYRYDVVDEIEPMANADDLDSESNDYSRFRVETDFEYDSDGEAA